MREKNCIFHKLSHSNVLRSSVILASRHVWEVWRQYEQDGKLEYSDQDLCQFHSNNSRHKLGHAFAFMLYHCHNSIYTLQIYE